MAGARSRVAGGWGGGPGGSALRAGAGPLVAEVGATEGVPGGWSLITVDRIPVLAIFTILFVVAVLVVAGRKGFFGLLGLVVSGVVLFGSR